MCGRTPDTWVTISCVFAFIFTRWFEMVLTLFHSRAAFWMSSWKKLKRKECSWQCDSTYVQCVFWCTSGKRDIKSARCLAIFGEQKMIMTNWGLYRKSLVFSCRYEHGAERLCHLFLIDNETLQILFSGRLITEVVNSERRMNMMCDEFFNWTAKQHTTFWHHCYIPVQTGHHAPQDVHRTCVKPKHSISECESWEIPIAPCAFVFTLTCRMGIGRAVNRVMSIFVPELRSKWLVGCFCGQPNLEWDALWYWVMFFGVREKWTPGSSCRGFFNLEQQSFRWCFATGMWSSASLGLMGCRLKWNHAKVCCKRFSICSRRTRILPRPKMVQIARPIEVAEPPHTRDDWWRSSKSSSTLRQTQGNRRL